MSMGHLKIVNHAKDPTQAKLFLEQKIMLMVLLYPISSYILESHSNKNSIVFAQNRHMVKWDNKEVADTGACCYSHLNF